MRIWKNMISKFVLVIIIMVSFLAFQLSTNAATINTQITQVGQPLAVPDPGWKRYEETATGFVFEGSNWKVSNSAIYSGRSEKYAFEPYSHSVKFSFFGTGLRLASYRGLDRQSSISVSIDGANYTYSANGAVQTNTLLFEKTNLENKVHSVIVSSIPVGAKLFEIDAVDINDNGYLITSPIDAPMNLLANAGDKKVVLNWTASSNATNYTIKRSTTAGGPYETIATNITSTVYSDTSAINEITYHYVVIAVNTSGQSFDSNEVSAKPQGAVVPNPEPSGDRAILTITLTTGLEKEYDLSTKEVNGFLDWYDARDSGKGPAKFAINKHNNNKGPFTGRKEYVIFDKILTFSVDEYTAK